MRGLAHIALPLTRLTKKATPWQCGQNQQQAFDTLKQNLIEPPILRPADPTKPFVIRTGASGYALGAVLLQGEKEDEQPTKYASR